MTKEQKLINEATNTLERLDDINRGMIDMIDERTRLLDSLDGLAAEMKDAFEQQETQ